MSESFITGLWGVYNNKERFLKRRSKIDNDIKLAKNNTYMPSFKVYVFGEENYKKMIDDGFDCKLVDKKPIVWDMDTQQFRHKLEVLSQGLHDFDKILFFDWDCQPICPIPDDFWNILGKKISIQAHMRMYHRRKAYWRKRDQRQIIEASFVYIREKQIGLDLIDKWEKMNKPWSEEIVIMRYIDDIDGGWKGISSFWEKYEPEFNVRGPARFLSPYLHSLPNTFLHMNAKTVGNILARSNKVSIGDILMNMSNQYKPVPVKTENKYKG
jgi:hypothetical protein